MNREQAAKIHAHLPDAADAIRRANDVLFDFDKETRKTFAEYIGYIDSDLHFECCQSSTINFRT
jgi:hypothetical protein